MSTLIGCVIKCSDGCDGLIWDEDNGICKTGTIDDTATPDGTKNSVHVKITT